MLLESASGGEWDILFAFPQRLTLHSALDLADHDFFALLEREIEIQPGAQPGDIPFRGGWFVYLGYELLHRLEPRVRLPLLDTTFPLAALMRVPAAILVNRKRGETLLMCEAAQHPLTQMRRDIAELSPTLIAPLPNYKIEAEDPQIFLSGVARIQQYIHEGDAFQVNLARRWQAEFEDLIDPAVLYRNLREKNPAPFSGIADFGSHQIVSSSPERLVRVHNGSIETRPIAGTHPRSDDPNEDRELKARLRAHPKERAEHIMLVDLERNDLGKICEPGSVSVSALMQVESYAHVHHIESEIHGSLRDGVSAAAVLRAVFPGGTITGCPKVRTMQIIRELEPSPRMAYTGSMGYINHDGDLDFNILIRSFTVDGAQVTFKAGAGIVADSDPQRELQETLAKAKGLLRALA